MSNQQHELEPVDWGALIGHQFRLRRGTERLPPMDGLALARRLARDCPADEIAHDAGVLHYPAADGGAPWSVQVDAPDTARALLRAHAALQCDYMVRVTQSMPAHAIEQAKDEARGAVRTARDWLLAALADLEHNGPRVPHAAVAPVLPQPVFTTLDTPPVDLDADATPAAVDRVLARHRARGVPEGELIARRKRLHAGMDAASKVRTAARRMASEIEAMQAVSGDRGNRAAARRHWHATLCMHAACRAADLPTDRTAAACKAAWDVVRSAVAHHHVEQTPARRMHAPTRRIRHCGVTSGHALLAAALEDAPHAPPDAAGVPLHPKRRHPRRVRCRHADLHGAIHGVPQRRGDDDGQPRAARPSGAAVR